MDKNTKLILGVLLLGTAGFLYAKQKKDSKVSYTGNDALTGMPSAVGRRQR